jgi:hypothetical protein
VEDYKKHFVLFLVMVLILGIPLFFLNKKDNKEIKNNNKFEEELHVDQIYFKNIEILNPLPIDQSLLIQDEVFYFLRDNKEKVDEVEIVQGSLEDLGDFKYRFKIKYKNGILEVYVDKNKVNIVKSYQK